MKNIIKLKKFWVILIILVTITVSAVIVLMLVKPNKNNPQSNNKTIDINPPQLPKDSHILSILLMGYGGAGHDGGYLTDAMQLFYADFDKGKIALISIPRDLWIKTDNNEAKINTIWFKNNKDQKGIKNSKNIISQILGLPISYYITADFVGFQKAIGENLKGIEVDVNETLDDPWYPIKGEEQNLCGKTPEETTELTKKLSGFELEQQFTCRYEHLLFQKGINKMQGGEALKYVRSRHGSSEGDISRGKRQQEVLISVSKKIFSINALDNIEGFITAVSKNIQTDLNTDIVKVFLPFLKNAANTKIININLSTNNVLTTGISSDRQAIIIPKEGNFNWLGLQKYIIDELNKN